MKYLKDPKDNQPSVTLTVFAASFGVALFKLLTSGLVVGSVQAGNFSGSDFAATVGAAGAIYWARRNVGGPNE